MIVPMRLTAFHRLVADEFGTESGDFILHSHVLADHGATAEQLLERGVDPREIWLALCTDFEVPEERRLGRDD